MPQDSATNILLQTFSHKKNLDCLFRYFNKHNCQKYTKNRYLDIPDILDLEFSKYM